MPTVDPHIALIDAHEKLEGIKAFVSAAVDKVKAKAARGEKPTADDLHMVKAIRAEVIERTRRIQDELYEELESHGKLN
jgi:Na+/phosphate symporter